MTDELTAEQKARAHAALYGSGEEVPFAHLMQLWGAEPSKWWHQRKQFVEVYTSAGYTFSRDPMFAQAEELVAIRKMSALEIEASKVPPLSGALAFRPLLDSIHAAIGSRLWYPALLSSMMLPDQCGRIQYGDAGGKASLVYIRWFDEFAAPRLKAHVDLTGEIVYQFRNSLVHEATSFTRAKVGFDRLVFSHNKIATISGIVDNCGGIDERGLIVDFVVFVETMLQVAADWIEGIDADEDRTRYDRLLRAVRYHPDGIHNYIQGAPVIG